MRPEACSADGAGLPEGVYDGPLVTRAIHSPFGRQLIPVTAGWTEPAIAILGGLTQFGDLRGRGTRRFGRAFLFPFGTHRHSATSCIVNGIQFLTRTLRAANPFTLSGIRLGDSLTSMESLEHDETASRRPSRAAGARGGALACAREAPQPDSRAQASRRSQRHRG